MTNSNDHQIALQEAYANLYNEIVKPDRVFVATQYFRKKWVPLLGPSLSWVIMALRQHCYWSRETGEKRDWCLISQEELAREAGISVATLKRLLKHKYADKFIIEIKHRYRYDSKKRKQVRKKSQYRIRMDDPLIPDDEIILREKLAQKLTGLNIDPETGQLDMLELLDRLSQTGVDDLQLKLSHKSDDASETKIDQLVEQVGQILTGPSNDPEAIPYTNAIHVPADALRDFELAPNQVLITWSDDFLAVPLNEIIKRDLRRSGGDISSPSRTECFYSTLHALNEGPDHWLPEEEKRIKLMRQLEYQLSEQFQQLGDFSLEEALLHYFSPQLTAEILKDKSDTELQRIQNWVIYTRQAKSLKNPAGFLRSRLNSDESPPSVS